MSNRFFEMDLALKRNPYERNGWKGSESFSGPAGLQDITHAGSYRIAYDRLTKLGIIEPLPGRDTRKFKGTAALQDALNAWVPYLDKVLSPPAYILTGGMTVNKPGEHGKGNAIDVDGFWWSDANIFLAINAPSDWVKYLTIEASLRKVFGTVLNYDYNADHHDHWHCDLGGNTSWRAVKSQALFAQRALNVIWGENLAVDGAWGNNSKTAASKHNYDLSASGGWERFLDDIINRQSSMPAVAKSFSSKKQLTNVISKNGIDLIKGFEGFKSSMYNDPAGHCTIGYGTLLHPGNCNGDKSETPYVNGISESQAIELLVERLKEFQSTVNNNTTVELSANQFDSLVSFTYNVGSGNFKASTLLKLLNQGNYQSVPGELRKWTKGRVNGQLVDLPGLVKRRGIEADLFAAPTASIAQSIIDFSIPLYDTGEHAILGEHLDILAGSPLTGIWELAPTKTYDIKSVPFTYGQIMTLGDFYDSYDWMMKNASVTELTGLKKLIEQNENFYKNLIFKLKLPNAFNIKHKTWNTATSDRYMDLALKNYSHFAPPPSGIRTSTKNNKQVWEMYHKDAINKARSGKTNVDHDKALAINAFGDHFLTDAFSAGHLINKEFVLNKFINNVLTNGKVNSAGEKMFERIADLVLKDAEMKRLLGQYEINSKSWYEPNWDLDNTGVFYPEVFYRLLKKVMEDKDGREQIANLAVKAVHDFLDEYKGGVFVTSNVDKKGWSLTGDGTLNEDNIKRVQLAVKQSVQNISDSITNPTITLAAFYKKVWDHVPEITNPNTLKIVNSAINDFTNPASSNLLNKAFSLLKGENIKEGGLQLLLDVLYKRNKILKK